MKVLIIEKDPDIRRFAAESLQRRGHDVLLQEESRGGMESLGQTQFDLVLLDWRYPAEARRRICRFLGKSVAGRPYLLVVGINNESPQWREALSWGADDILSLPHDPFRLAERLTSAQAAVQRRRTGSEASPALDSEVVPPGDPPDHLLERLSTEELHHYVPREIEGSTLARELSSSQNSEANLFKQAQLFVLDSIWRAEAGKPPDMALGEELARGLANSLQGDNHELLLSATDRTQEFSVSSHSVNVAILALRIARTLDLQEERLFRVAMAALLHEIGVIKLASQLVHKTESLATSEVEALRERPLYSAQILEKLGKSYDWLPDIVAQVFEREDGSGHPNGLTGEAIRREAKIIGIADVFEACIHVRPYRPALTGYQLLSELTGQGTESFAQPIVKALIQAFTLYTYNEYVVLNTGEIGRVVEIETGNLSRPVVNVLYNEYGHPRIKPKQVNLAENPSLYITQAITLDAVGAG